MNSKVTDDAVERLIAAVDELQRRVDIVDRGVRSALDRIDREYANLRKSVVMLADHDRGRTEDAITFANANESLTARVGRLETQVDFVLRHERTVQ